MNSYESDQSVQMHRPISLSCSHMPYSTFSCNSPFNVLKEQENQLTQRLMESVAFFYPGICCQSTCDLLMADFM